MNETDIIAWLYESASGDRHWDDVGRALGSYFDAHPIDLVMRSRAGRMLVSEEGGVVGTASVHPEALAAYVEHFEPIDPLREGALTFPRGNAWIHEQLISHTSLQRTEFFNEWLPLVDTACMAGGCAKLPHGLLHCSLRRSDRVGPFTLEDRERLQSLLPHFVRAFDVAHRLREARGRSASIGAALDAVSDAVLALGEDGEVLHSNAAAESLRRAGVIGRTLPGRGPLATRAPIRTTKRGRVYLWVYRPVPPRLGRTGAAALLFVTEQAQAAAPNPAWLRVRFGLSPAEAELVLALLDGDTLEDFAERRGVRVSTARTQLKSAFNKTDTRRQAELVTAVLAALPRLRLASSRTPEPDASGPSSQVVPSGIEPSSLKP